MSKLEAYKIEKKLSKDQKMLKEYRQFLEQINDRNFKVKIVNAGIFNAGKSSLFNGIIGKEVFLVGDIPTTAQNTIYETDDYIFVDTPGLDANDVDELEAEKAYRTSDIILFVHNAVDGEINAIEMNYLKKILEFFPKKIKKEERFVLILSNKDQLEEAKLNQIKSKIEVQISENLNLHLKNIFMIDSQTHIQGLNDNEDLLIDSSGLNGLKQFISDTAIKLDSIKNDLYTRRLHESKQKLYEAIDKYLENESGKYRKDIDSLAILDKDIETIEETIKSIINMKSETEIFKIAIPEKVGFYYYFRNLSDVDDRSSYKYYSEREAERAGIEKYNRAYSELKSEVSDVQYELEKAYREYAYYEAINSNFYYKINNTASKSLQNIIDYIGQKLKTLDSYIPVRLNLDFSIKPESNDIIEYINSTKIRNMICDFGDKDRYHNKIRTDYEIEYKERFLFKGLADTETKKYRYEIYNAISALRDKAENRVEYANNNISSKLCSILNSFYSKVKDEFENRFSILTKHLNEIVENKKEESKKLNNKINALNALKKEFSEIKEIVESETSAEEVA